MPLNCAVQNHFQAIQKLCAKHKRPSHHRQSLVTLSRRYFVIDGPSNFFKNWHDIFLYRHSLARTIESELHPDGVINIPESGSIRLRRCSTIEAPNEALLFEDNAGVVDVDKPRTRAPKLQRQSSMEEVEKTSCKLEPRIESRIVVLNEDTLPHLLSERQAWEKSVARPIRESSEN